MRQKFSMKNKKRQLKDLIDNPKELKHSWKVSKRIVERKKVENDIENGCYEQIYVPSFNGTHPMFDENKYNQDRMTKWLREFKKPNSYERFEKFAIVCTVIYFGGHVIRELIRLIYKI